MRLFDSSVFIGIFRGNRRCERTLKQLLAGELAVGVSVITLTTLFLQSLRATYDAVRRLDAPLTFVSERQFMAGGAVDFKVILLPAVRYMPRGVFERVDGYLRNGGNLVVLPESLLADEYACSQGYLAEWGIEVSAVDVPAIEGLGAAEQGYDQSFSQEARFGKGRDLRATGVDADFFGGDVEVETTGVFQEIVSEGGQVLAEAGRHVVL